MVDMALHERALEIWDSARATLESGDRSDLSRLQIEDAFALFEEEIERLRASLSRAEEVLRCVEWYAPSTLGPARRCPFCKSYKSAGHDPACDLGKVLAGGVTLEEPNG